MVQVAHLSFTRELKWLYSYKLLLNANPRFYVVIITIAVSRTPSPVAGLLPISLKAWRGHFSSRLSLNTPPLFSHTKTLVIVMIGGQPKNKALTITRVFVWEKGGSMLAEAPADRGN